jgi:hypothetical protein
MKMKIILMNYQVTYLKTWRKYPNICNDIVMACPFCTYTYSENIRKGNLEHLHLYCSSKHLKKARYHCYQKIELHNIYNFASMLEYNCPFDESTRNTTLFENLYNAAIDAETQLRPIVKSSHLVNEARSNNIAIKSRVEIQRLILIRKMEPTKLEEFDTFPLTSQLGIIHAIPEEDFDIARATVSDLWFLGLFQRICFKHYVNMY